MKIALVVPHIFMHRDILPQVIFSPATLAIELAEGLEQIRAEVTLFSPGPVDVRVRNQTADLSLFEKELEGRGYGYIELLKKHPATFIALARQVQAELTAKAFAAANSGEFDLVHIYTNEEDIALPFVQLCTKPVVFTHHDPFNFLIKYKTIFPKYKQLHWISMSLAQRSNMPKGTNWLANIYHGVDDAKFQPNYAPHEDYVAYLGRIIKPKGVHLAIKAVQRYNKTATKPLKLKIAGKHYAGEKDTYWQEYIQPHINEHTVEYIGFVRTDAEKQALLGNAKALLVPSVFDEPFGMVLIEALACATPVIGLTSGAIPEVITNTIGQLVEQQADDDKTAEHLARALQKIESIDRHACRTAFEQRFTTKRMCAEHLRAYSMLTS